MAEPTIASRPWSTPHLGQARGCGATNLKAGALSLLHASRSKPATVPIARAAASVGWHRARLDGTVIREELHRLITWEERHQRLLARLLVAAVLTLLIDVVGAVAVWHWEAGPKGSDIHGFTDALFFSTYQVLTVSSSMKNPLTAAGKLINVLLELWAVLVVSAIAGSFATFFTSSD